MIHRTSTHVRVLHDYAAEMPAESPVPGGSLATGAVVFTAETDYDLVYAITGISLRAGSLKFDGVSYPAGEFMFKIVGDDVLLYRTDAFGEGELLTTITTETPQVTFGTGTIMNWFLGSDSATVVATNIPPGGSFSGHNESAGQVQFDLNVPRSNHTHLVKDAEGVEHDEWIGWLYPGDTVRYVPIDYAPEPIGDSYQLSVPSDTLQERIDKLDEAFRGGGLLRQGPMLEELAYPEDSSSYLDMGSLTYRLNDGLATQEFTVQVQARTGSCRLLFTHQGRQELVTLTGNAHFTGRPSGFAVAWGAQVQAVALERLSNLDVFIYRFGTGDPTCVFREGDAWVTSNMPYLTTVGAGYLTDRRYRVRLTAGPYLATDEYLDAHTRYAVLAGSQDVTPGEFVQMVVDNQMHTYMVAGVAAFDNHYALLVRGD